MPESTRVIGSGQVPLYLIGDSPYPSKCWLMKSFLHNSQLSEPQKYYNYRICHAWIVVKNAFGRLEARRRLMKKNEMSTSNIPSVTAACCVIYNVCEIHGDSQWILAWRIWANNEIPQPRSVEGRDDEGDRSKLIRDALFEHFFSQRWIDHVTNYVSANHTLFIKKINGVHLRHGRVGVDTLTSDHLCSRYCQNMSTFLSVRIDWSDWTVLHTIPWPSQVDIVAD